ncbi:hypothetical protein MANES_03G069017v8 [Manihot esculenta]|uniref:Uncharacterized protein n=1 Tax=Manihot esculenta TaxID=3983 RepID=A0ACB7HY63_MANES|nr:hypothetical protein MANES_03G069017v8 [Manihot esculenta]
MVESSITTSTHFVYCLTKRLSFPYAWHHSFDENKKEYKKFEWLKLKQLLSK